MALVRRGPFQSVDVYVGSRLRLRRRLLGLSQEKLAEAIGITFQQIQKYERGANRVSASRLYDLAQVLAVPIDYFFDGIGSKGDEQQKGPEILDASAAEHEPEAGTDQDNIELVRWYYRIQDPLVRRRLYEVTKAIAAESARNDQ